MLHHGNGPDAVLAGVEAVDHRLAGDTAGDINLAAQARAEHVPAAHRAFRADSCVVGPAKAADAGLHHHFSERRAAVLLKHRRVERGVEEGLVTALGDDGLGYFGCCELEAGVGLTGAAVPLAVSDESASGENATVG